MRSASLLLLSLRPDFVFIAVQMPEMDSFLNKPLQLGALTEAFACLSDARASG